MGVYQRARTEMKQQIMRSFWTLYREQPISKITAGKVAQVSGIHRSTVYFYFRDVYQILEEIEAGLMAHLAGIDVNSGETEAGLNAAGRILFQEYRKNREYLRILVKEQRDYAFSLRYRQELVYLMVQMTKTTTEVETPFQQQLIALTASVIVEVFLQCADDEAFSFEETQRILEGFMKKGFYGTLHDTFQVPNLRNPRQG